MSEPTTGPSPEITFDDFSKVDIRIGRVLTAERIPKKDKLLKLSVDLGEVGIRTVIAGIGKVFAPETLVGVRALFVVNLAPREFQGVGTSHGMILAAPDPVAGLVLPTVTGVSGTRVG